MAEITVEVKVTVSAISREDRNEYRIVRSVSSGNPIFHASETIDLLTGDIAEEVLSTLENRYGKRTPQ